MMIRLMTMAAMIGAQCVAAEITLPAHAEVKVKSEDAGNTWQEFGTIPLAYTAAKSNFDLALRKQGWSKLNSVDYDRVRWKSLEIWTKNGEKILIQLWREDTGLTGFSWGTWREGGKS